MWRWGNKNKTWKNVWEGKLVNEHYLVGDDALRLLIVEDEAPIRRGLLHHVNWQNLGIGEIQMAENADEALCLIADFRPDIIVSDIRMPGMDGTQMARIVKERLPDCQIIFISGYSDKEYLQAAISLGAAGYVEKPINIEELEQVVRKAQKAIQKNRQNNETALHALIYHPQQTAEYGEENHWDHYVVFAVRVKEDTGIQLHELEETLLLWAGGRWKGRCRVMADQITSGNYAVFLQKPDSWTKEEPSQVCRRILSIKGEEEHWFVGAGREWSGKEHISDAYKDSVKTLRHLSWKGWGAWADSQEVSSDFHETLSDDTVKKFKQMIQEGKEQEAISFVNEQARSLVGQKAQMNFYVRALFHTLDQAVHDVLLEKSGMNEEKEWAGEAPVEFDTIREYQDLIRSHIHETILVPEIQGKSNYSVKEICRYIDEHAGDKDLSLRELSEQVYLTPSYLSSLFSKTMGMTVGQYITSARIKKACELLKDPEYKLYQVAELVGYDDPKYFTRLFKKKTGMTPSEYRDKL